MSHFAVLAKTPLDCTVAELDAFTSLARASGEVHQHNLDHRISRAQALVFARVDAQIAGIGAIKLPKANYRASVFRKAAVLPDPSNFPYELGWVFVEPRYRGQGLSHEIVRAAVAQAARVSLYATSAVNNHQMHATLRAAGFQRSGIQYPSRDESRHVALFLRFVTDGAA